MSFLSRNKRLLTGILIPVGQLVAAGLAMAALFVWHSDLTAWIFTGLFGALMVSRYLIKFLVPNEPAAAHPPKMRFDSPDR